ncbi:uncharacterized protein LOC119613538 [Lucilia sericata]|uniref:uncharacterized protein LOC119613538 n=1 Tax=Lucilia sericata TaxID=13632 RepID=UPI0018A8395B|nr:uncharacterized protein LOC119613538 [Lucilia sericata]
MHLKLVELLAGMAPHSENFKCPQCDKNVTKTQRSVGCAYCGEYFHIKCADISLEQHSILLKNKVLKYICSNCTNIRKGCNVQEELRNGFAALKVSLEKDLEEKIQASRQLLNEHLEAGLRVIEEKFSELSNSQPICDVELIKSDLKHCFDVVKVVDNAANSKLIKLETQASILQRRLNRANVVIWGLPKKIKDLRTPVRKIFSLCNVSVSDTDLQHCTYFAGGKAVLVKFNSIQVRDIVMFNYNKARNIKLSDVIPSSVHSKIIINDHLTDAARKLISVCRRLRNEGKFVKYKFKNYDIPKASITMNDGSVKLLSYNQCIELFGDLNNCSLSPINISNPSFLST